jgi:hypothetical protein
VAGRRGTGAGGAPDPGAAVCGLARCGRSCGSALGGRPHGIHLDLPWLERCVDQRVQENPWGFGKVLQVFDERLQRHGDAAKGSPAARVNNRWATRPIARPGVAKQTARHEKRVALAGFGLTTAGDRVTGGVAGVAGTGGLDSRARGDAGQRP